jgi:hypothetical protein
LRFKRVRPTEPIYSVRISQDYRALGVSEDDTMIRFWIGSHADYDDLISRLQQHLLVNCELIQLE